MANSDSAVKRHRQSLERRAHNRAARSRLRTAIQKVRRAVVETDGEAARRLLPQTLQLLDATAGKKIIHRNTAARQKSRLSRLVGGLG